MKTQPIPTKVATFSLWERTPQPAFTNRLLSLYRASGRPA
jgi:hypothetical protein